jgi:hemin uptake protein HemP
MNKNKHSPNSVKFLHTELPSVQYSVASLCPRLCSEDLFIASNEVIIEHSGEEYRLRLTRQGKLILTK